MKRFTSARYEVHKAALRPVLSGQLPLEGFAGPEDFAAFLYQQRLHTCWLKLVSKQPGDECFHELIPHLRQYSLLSAARELPQQRVLQEVAKLFDANNIDWFIAKGALLRHVIYEETQLRPAVDIDGFVHPPQRERAAQLLVDNGFVARPLPETLSHEIKLTRYNADVDLHWHLFRPGRARGGVMDWLFAHRQPFNGLQGLDNTASLFVMLVHPAFTKYLLSPTSMLIHLVDQSRLMGSETVDWKELEAALERTGTRTAAWSSLYVLKMLGGVEAPDGFEERIRPGRLHAWYLENWIDRGWIEKWFNNRWVAGGLFSLALQDTFGDARRALATMKKVRNNPDLEWEKTQ